MRCLLKFLWTNSYRKGLKVSSFDLLVMYLQECMFLIIPSADRKFVELLQYRFHRDTRPGYLEDVYDGTAYTSSGEFFSYKYVSFALNYDGAPKFKSSKIQLWPVQLYLNELPPYTRYIGVYVYTGMPLGYVYGIVNQTT